MRARARDARRVRALLHAPAGSARTRSTRSRRARSATPRTPRTSWRARASDGLADPRAEQPRGGPLRLSRGGQLDHATRRLRARPRRRLAAAGARARAPRARVGLLAARRGAHDRALPAGQRAGQAPSSSTSCAPMSAGELARAPTGWRGAGRAGGWWASAAPCATWPPRRSAPPACPPTACRASVIEREALEELIERLAALPAAERGSVPGIKPARADLILAGAVVHRRARCEAGGFDAHRGHRGGPARGRLLLEHLLADRARRCSRTSAARACSTWPRQYHVDIAHTRARRRSSRCGMFDELAPLGLHGGDPLERELLWAAVHAARHRHVGRLRRPPQALALPDPQRRACRASRRWRWL